MEKITKNNFKYAALFDESGDYYSDGLKSGLKMGVETQKRYDNNDDDCAVTVCCITYKHEDLIAKALDSFLMQKTNFKFKVFVGEDHGPDGTADIIRRYAEKYPDIIIPFIRENNMGAQANLIDLCNHANSPYIAFCEGDDYWTDEYKLQKQFDYMQEHDEFRACYTRTEIVAPDDWFLLDWFKKDKQGKLIFPDCEPTYKLKTAPLTADDCVFVFPVHTSTVFYRWNYDVEIPDWYYTGIIGDHPIFMMQLGEGRAAFIPDVTSVYRRSDVGVYMSKNMEEHFMKTRLDHLRWMTGMLSWYEEHQKKYPEADIKNRIKLETYNYLSTVMKSNNFSAVQEFFMKYPYAAELSLNAYLGFFSNSQTLIRAFKWRAYDLIVNKKIYRYALRLYGISVILLEKLKNVIKKQAGFLYRKVKDVCSFFCYWFYTLHKKEKNLWAITSFRGKGYLDNSKYFYEYVVKNHPEINIYWLTLDDEIFEQLKSEGKPVYKSNSRSGRKILSHAEIAIIDHTRTSDLNPCFGFNNRTKVVQLWHGVGFKAMGDGKRIKGVSERGAQYSDDILCKNSDNIFVKLIKKIKYFFIAHRRELFEKYFMLVCPGTERVEMLGKIWRVPEQAIFMAGHPRDVFSYTLSADSTHPKVMYAPTFRYDPKKESQLIDTCIKAFNKIEETMKKIDGTFVIRLHPHTWRDYESRITAAMQDYPHIQIDREKDVYTRLGTYNVVITDYSSISLDFAILDRPVVYFCPDYSWFNNTQTGFNLDFPNVIPGPLTGSWDETLEKVKEYALNPQKDSDLRAEKCKYFFDKSVNGPDNSERIVKEIKKRINLN